ncbi:MAG: MBL fold metallo-hydrolase [Chthoniobacterales bacterium]|nr:MBL fold metallo-hydrolase [Chthoniobacterales bacterium]
MKFTNLTRAEEIGANCYLIEAEGSRVLLDAGMHPREMGAAATPDFRLLGGKGFDALVLTHAHQDHVGCVPLAMRQAPGKPVFMTEATAALSDVMLHNSVNVMMRQREESGVVDYPLFSHREVERLVDDWRIVPLSARFDVAGERAGPDSRGLTCEFFDAGHILGSVGVLIRAEGRRVFYTGDVNFEDQTLMRGAKFPEENIDVLIMETTRGDSPVPQGFTRKSEEQRFLATLQSALDAGAPVLIPVFALGKTQELLALLYEGKKTGALRGGFGLYVGGLGAKITAATDRLRGSSPRQHGDLKLAACLPMEVVGGQDISQLPVIPRTVYAVSSGMMTENTLSNTLAPRILENPSAHCMFVGFSDPKSPAGLLRSAPEGADVVLDARRRPVRRRCKVDEFTLSAHATREHLLDYARRVQPKKIILVHGDPPAVAWFAREIPRVCPNTEVLVPPPGQVVEI